MLLRDHSWSAEVTVALNGGRPQQRAFVRTINCARYPIYLGDSSLSRPALRSGLVHRGSTRSSLGAHSCMLARPVPVALSNDYGDACEVSSSADRTAEAWLRAMFEDTPVPLRLVLRGGWTLLTLHRPGGVLGWPLTVTDLDRAALRTTSRIGLITDLELTKAGTTVRFTTGIHFERRIARLVWTPVAPIHRLMVRWMLANAAE